ncbi:MAG: toll/interleukin-1 receptor domain-containing protein [Flavobacteriales bacterium]|nr:toll/interleukin-1 receptor domain-containing protein [Flavobacteriales bacterium]
MKAKIFYSYSHADEEFRVELEKHLSILKRTGMIEDWHDRRIAPGSDWEQEIDTAIDEADIILLLVSSNFLASDYCYDTETIRALERHADPEDDAVIIPIILQPCLWELSHFADEKIQAIPRDNKPISTWNNKDEAWVTVAREIVEEVKKINKTKEEKEPIFIHEDDNDSRMMEQIAADPREPLETLGSFTDFVNEHNETHQQNRQLILDFLENYSNWYFSPLRIRRWGGQQRNFEGLATLKSTEIYQLLNKLEKEGKTVSKISRKGNPIFKFNK